MSSQPQQPPPQCPKHEKDILYICSYQICKDHRILCQVCKQKQTLHFSNHVNYIHKYEKLKQFNNAMKTIPQLQKGLNDCQNYIVEHRKYYTNLQKSIQIDMVMIKNKFIDIAQKFQDLYTQTMQKQIDKFDEELNQIKKMLRQYIKQKNTQDSFFTMLFQSQSNITDVNDCGQIQGIIQKNKKAFQVRADIINLKSSIALAKNNQIQYKQTEEDNSRLQMLAQQMECYVVCVYDKFKDIIAGGEAGDWVVSSQNLKNSVVNQCKSLAMSKMALGNMVHYDTDLKKSQVSIASDRSMQKVPLPALNTVVANTRDKLKPLEPKHKGNFVMDGPYLYSTGVYFGQLQNNKRNGWGQFVFNDGSIYEGQWEKDNIDGYGRLIRNDCYYEGYVKAGRAHGSGNYENFYRYYAGQWKNDKRNGTGQEEIKNKSKKYVGNFVDDKYNGRGRLTTQEYAYEGKFKDGLFHGDGKIKYFNGENFEGSFIQGEKQMGRHIYPDSSYYDGMFKNNVPEGTGQFFWADGLKFSGQWKKGIQDGMGLQIYPDGKQLKGIWKAGHWQKWL